MKLVKLFGFLACIAISGFFSWRFIPHQSKEQTVVSAPATYVSSWMNINKIGVNLNEDMEGTPFVWKGKLYYFVSDRKDPNATVMRIFDFNTKSQVAVFGQGQQLTLGSAYVEGDMFYAFGTKDAGDWGKSAVYMITSKDLSTFSNPVQVYHAGPTVQLFNTSVTKNTDTGNYIMAIETTTQGELTPFTIYFLTSPDLLHWNLVPNTVFGKDTYVAAPTIRYVNHAYYLWFLMREFNDPNCTGCISFVTKTAKSSDLSSWQTSPHFFLVPDRPDEGINTSDADLTEYNGKVYILYAIGDQAKWVNMRYATYDGTLTSLVSEFFPTSVGK